jgi:hypothetical protein
MSRQVRVGYWEGSSIDLGFGRPCWGAAHVPLSDPAEISMTLVKPLRRSRTAASREDVAPLIAAVPRDGGRLRRCTYRRICVAPATSTRPGDRNHLPTYVVSCLYPNLRQALPLGDLNSAKAICNACVATGVFRPDED